MGASSEQRHECRVCGAVFGSVDELSAHSGTHYKTTEGQGDQTR